MWANAKNHWFLISIGLCFGAGYFAESWLAPITQIPLLRDGVVFVVMWAMGVTLAADTVRESIAKPTAALLAILINVFVVPLLALPSQWFLPAGVFGGLFVAALIPCTLASASVWTRRAGGDDSVTMMTTVVTNLACIAVVPIGLTMVLSRVSNISATDQILKLSILVALPLVIAQTMRGMGAAGWADRNKPRLSLLGQCGILVMVVFGAIASRQTVDLDGGESLNWPTLVILCLAAAAIHTTAFAIGIVASRGMGIDRDRQIAVGIGGSQKTLMVGLQIAIDCGVSVVPMLVYHLSQLVIDTAIVDRWKKKDNER
ncbi:bile acid:sodium symporter family protein [Rubripirellula reticaptiva]|uniref:Sodium Bile acid symporter family protein n=1 Tax=Rubripirellula reticaptiva TaxID=2528013 RepID=A0A5C6F789_9BACT|nr:bile acid:sodium symporter [Rubripirellula reticaptiva]TWU57258.1 Sodium Bile acid symporter family protein [Rubripirellula reticaptiva]